MRPLDVSPTSWRSQLPRQNTGYLFPMVCLLAVAAFIALPGAVDEKTQQALHGLCAQRPSHSYWLGDARLPFDARMTGIYGGCYDFARDPGAAGPSPRYCQARVVGDRSCSQRLSAPWR